MNNRLMQYYRANAVGGDTTKKGRSAPRPRIMHGFGVVLVLPLLVRLGEALEVNAHVCVLSAAVKDRDTTGGASDPYFNVRYRSSSSGSWSNVCETSTISNDNTPSWGSSGDCCLVPVDTNGQISFKGWDSDYGSDESLGTTAAKDVSTIWSSSSGTGHWTNSAMELSTASYHWVSVSITLWHLSPPAPPPPCCNEGDVIAEQTCVFITGCPAYSALVTLLGLSDCSGSYVADCYQGSCAAGHRNVYASGRSGAILLPPKAAAPRSTCLVCAHAVASTCLSPGRAVSTLATVQRVQVRHVEPLPGALAAAATRTLATTTATTAATATTKPQAATKPATSAASASPAAAAVHADAPDRRCAGARRRQRPPSSVHLRHQPCTDPGQRPQHRRAVLHPS